MARLASRGAMAPPQFRRMPAWPPPKRRTSPGGNPAAYFDDLGKRNKSLNSNSTASGKPVEGCDDRPASAVTARARTSRRSHLGTPAKRDDRAVAYATRQLQTTGRRRFGRVRHRSTAEWAKNPRLPSARLITRVGRRCHRSQCSTAKAAKSRSPGRSNTSLSSNGRIVKSPAGSAMPFLSLCREPIPMRSTTG
jgi:hypothetical protein